MSVKYPLATTTWGAEEYKAIDRVVNSGKFSMGEEVLSFERDCANYFGSAHAVMFNSGSSANLGALTAVMLKSRILERSIVKEPEVIVPAVSWSTTYFPISQAGYKLVFVDVDERTLNISIEGVLGALSKNTVGIVAVNLLGNPANLPQLKDICTEHELFLIEDNCESMGATLEGRQCGTYGEIGTFSTYFSHHISTMEGGFCLTDDPLLADILKAIRAHGWTRNLDEKSELNVTGVDKWKQQFTFVLPGYNLRPLEIEGAIGQEQLRKLPAIIAGRRANMKKFQELMLEFPQFLTQQENGESSAFGFSLLFHHDQRQILSRERLVRTLSELGIESRPVVTGNFTLQPAMKFLNFRVQGELKNSQAVEDFGLFIGNHHYQIERELETLRGALNQFLSQGSAR